MRFSVAAAALVPALAVSAANVTVLVGDGGALAFNPTSAIVQEGDTVIFEFRAKNHSVTQSTFANPCEIQTSPVEGVDSGFNFVAPGATELPQYSFTVDNASAPLWFFCAQTVPISHCQSGMVFALNPTAAKSFDAFQAAAKASANSSTGSTAPSGTPSGTSPSGFVTSNSPSPTGGSAAPPSNGGGSGSSGSNSSAPGAAPTGAAMRLGGGAAGALSVIAIVAGLLL